MTSPSGGQTYWGALPPPAVVAQRQASVRRNSYNANRKAQLPPDAELRGLHDSPYPSEAQPQSHGWQSSRQNRTSGRSNTTQSSQNTWIDDSVDQRGLTPRPGSWQHPPPGQQGPYNPEAEERRRRRASRQAEEERREWEQRGGISSNGNGNAPMRGNSHRHSNTAGQPEDFYRTNGYKPQRGPLSVNTDLGRSNTTGGISSQQQAADDAERGIRRGSVTARKEKPEIRSAVEDKRQRRPSGRRVSEVSGEGFTSDKSPLQALETNFAKLKEEKRAKAQEAERQIRERQASGASTATRGTQNTVHFDGSSEQATKTVSQRAVIEDAGHDISPKTSANIQDTTPRKQSSLSQPLEDRPSSKKLKKKKLNKTEQAWADLPAQADGRAPPAKGTTITREPPIATQQAWAGQAVQAHHPAAPAQIPTVIEPGVQRNSSFRERAGPNLAPEIILGTTASVGRRDSNKLKKNPPTDPWRLAREDMEMQAEEIARARRAEREQQQQQQRQRQRQVSGGPLGSSPIDPPGSTSGGAMMSGGSGKTHANTKKQRETSYVAEQPIRHDIDDDVGMTLVKRTNSQRKVEQLLGADVAFQKPNPDIRRAISPAEQQLYADRLDRSEELGPDGQGDIYGMSRQNVPISALTGDGASDHQDDHPRDEDGRHHFSNIIRGGRGNYLPGAGLYLPDKRLEEWKSAGIASLTGALLDLDTNTQAASAAQLEADKDKAWWEAGNKGKRRPSTGGAVRPMEAFGGDMSSEGNNGTVFSDFSFSYEDIVPVRSSTPNYGDRYGRPRTPQLVNILEADTPTRPHSTYSDRYARSGTPHLDNILETVSRPPSRYSGRYERQPIARLPSPKPRHSPGPRIPDRESSKTPRRNAVSAAASTKQKGKQLEDEDHVIPRARNVIGFDGTSKHKSTVHRRNRSLVQPTRFSKKQKPNHKKSVRRQKGPSVMTSGTKLSKKASFFIKDCRHPERHKIFDPFHICKPSIHRLQSKRKPSKKIHKLTSIVIAATKFSPPLYLKCGPLLRYTGIRREAVATRPGQPKRRDREIWRGSVMIVTTDAASSYSTPPTLRLFAQPKSLLPPPPETLDSGEELPHEYIDPIAGHPKCGRNGQTLYVRPVEFLPEEVDLSRDESDRGLFSRIRDTSSSSSTRQPTIDGEKTGKTVSVKGFRLHAERNTTFWRFNLEVELTKTQQRIAYRINSGPAIGFWVPALGEGMNIMNYSCNGFSMSVNADSFSGPDPLWRDVLNTHQTRPFHVMIGGGDQVYNDCVMRETSVFAEWLAIKNPLHKHNAPFTTAMQGELEEFYLERYAMWFSQGLFGLANSQIPMVNVWDDHDIIDGFGSYPHHFMDSPVFAGLGAIAFKYYMLFQQQSVVDEGPANEPSWLLGTKPGPYIKERSRSLFMSLGGGLSFLGLDCRTERTRDEVLSEQTYDAILDRCYAELVKGTTTHLIVLLGVPIAYPRLVWLENILTSRIMDPIKALSRAGAFGNLLNNFDGGVEILDDLDDHWTAKNHKAERRFLIQDLQDLAASKSVRITMLSGDVHLAAIGQFFSSKHEDGTSGPIPKDKDHRYMPNVISSAIVNTPPPDMLADVLARRDKIHHLDGETDENMIPLFGTDVDGKKRNNKVMLPRRNWASIRVYDGSGSPPGTPGASRTPSPEKGGGLGGLVRRLSMSKNDSFGPGPNRRQDSFGPRPPISGGGGGLLRRLSTSRGRPAAGTFDGAGEAAAPKRSSSTGGIGGLIRRLSQSRNRPPKRRDRGGINGYESETEEEYPYRDAPEIVRTRHGTFLRGGAAGGPVGDYSGDEEYQGMGLRGGGTVSRSEEAIERNQEYFAPKKGYRRGEEDPNDSDATPPPIRTGARGTSAGAAGVPLMRSNTYSDSRHGSVAPVSCDGSNLQRSNTTNTMRKSMHRTPTDLSAKGGLFGRKAMPEPVNLEGALEITLNVEVNKKDPAGITAPYHLLVPRLWYEEPVRPMGADGAMEDLPAPPTKRGNSFSSGLGGLMRRLSTTKKATPAQTPQFEQGDPMNEQTLNLRVGDRIGEGGLGRKPTVGDRMKDVFSLGRRRSTESYSGSEAESYDEHADTRLVPRANYGKNGKQGGPAPAVPPMNRGPPPPDDDGSELSRAPMQPAAPVAPAAPELLAKPAPYRNEPPRTLYRDPNTEAALERRASLDRPQAGIQRRNTISDKLKGAMSLGRRDSVGSYTGSDASYEEPTLPPPKKQHIPANARDTRGPYPILQQQAAQGRTSIDRPTGVVQRNNSLSAKLKGAMGLGRRDSVESWSGSEVDDPSLPPVNQRRSPLAAAEYDKVPQQQAMRASMDAGRPQKQERKNSRGGGLMRAMGLGRREAFSDRSYSGSEDESEIATVPRNNAAGQRINRTPLDRGDPSLGQREQGPPRSSLVRPQGGQRRTSLGGGLKKALGLGGERREEYDSHTESDDEEIARRQANERAAATGDKRYPSLPQDRPPPANANAGRASMDRRDGGRRVDSGPFPPQRKPTATGRLGRMIGLGRRSPTGSYSGSEHSWSEREGHLQTMPHGDERSAETDNEGGRGFKKVSGTKVERGQLLLREGQSGFTRQERQRARMEELGGEMERPGPRR